MNLPTAAAGGRFGLPVCDDCGTVQYPIREVCKRCLSERLSWSALKPQGVLLACTRLHRSMDERFAPRLPLEIGSVKLDAGPVVIALLDGQCEVGRPVLLSLTTGSAGKNILLASRGELQDGKLNS